MKKIVKTSNEKNLVFTDSGDTVAKSFELRHGGADRVLRSLHQADLVALHDLRNHGKVNQEEYKQKRDDLFSEYSQQSLLHFNDLDAKKTGSAYWEAYVNWYHLLALHHGQGEARWKDSGPARVQFDKMVTNCGQWRLDIAEGANHVDGSIITAGLFVVLSLDASQSNEQATENDIGKTIGSSRFHDLRTATNDRPLVKLLSRLCSLTEEMYEKLPIQTGKIGFKYSKGKEGDDAHPNLVGGKALYFIAKAVLERERVFEKTDEDRSENELKDLRAKSRDAMQPYFDLACGVIKECRGSDDSEPFKNINEAYQACYLSRALALLIRNENSHGNLEASRTCIQWGSELILKLEKMGNNSTSTNTYSNFYLPLAKSCLLRELEYDIRRLAPKDQSSAAK